jgi:UDP-2,3-diacylglucosamine pyrophosphatase LpxH
MNKYLIVSDIHLGDKDCKAEILLKVLKRHKAKTIIIAGDLFDHHNLNRLKGNHWKVLSKLRKLSKKQKVIYLIGNHCFLKAEFMSILLGFDCKDEYILELKDQKIKYITNFIIKLYYIFRHYTPFADDFFRLFRNHTNSFTEKSSDMKRNALKYIQNNNYDKVICGHSHIAEYSDKYINTGSFCEERASFVIIDNKNNIDLIKI